jgi:hypothetical protein
MASAVSKPVTQRLSTSEGSAQDHLTLLERGLNEATASPERALLGLGFGNSHLALQDFFPGNKYGNFHSMYVSTFAESGVVALLLLLILLGVPFIMSPTWRGIIAASAAFNLFYQTTTDPLFWFLLAFAWMAVSWKRTSGYSTRLSTA